MNLKKEELKFWNEFSKNSLMESLGIEYIKVDKGFVVGKMPVDSRTKQPFGQLHGGATLALIETMAGVGSSYLVDMDKFEPRGVNIAANLVRSVENGFVYCYGNTISQTPKSHLWKFEVKDEKENLIAFAQFTVVIVAKK